MELPQPRPYGTQGRKPTHVFLSLYSPVQQDPSPTNPGGCYLETHDFLQPLERAGKNAAKEGNKMEEQLIGKPLPFAVVEHVLPVGIGTSHISCINQSQRITKPEGVLITSSGSDKNDENSNSSSGSGFSLWEESAVNKRRTKENIVGNRHVITDGSMNIGGVSWMTSMERPSESSSIHNHPSTTISSLSSSRPSSAQNNQSFVDMLKSAKSSKKNEVDGEQEFVIKKEPSLHYKDTPHHDQKPNTPRSKHSATEQRRRSKINDRFSMLRGLIPHGDQKRDKASFLLEVIEYIEFLQQKVHKYEDSCRRWNNEPPAMIPWNNDQRSTDGFIDQSQVQNGVSRPKLVNKGGVASNIPKNGQPRLDSDLTRHEQNSQHERLTNLYSPGCGSIDVTTPFGSCTTDDATVACDKLKDQELTIESGRIGVSTIYSQGLLTTLTQALQKSGVDLSQANISVQIDIGKRAKSRIHDSSPLILKKNEDSDVTLERSRLASMWDDKNDTALKRSKTSRN